ncbi:MAG: hypothetical protein R2761_06735 [Acidimicrobiales bacterium]
MIAMIELPRRGDGRRQRRRRRAKTKAEAQRLLRQMRDELYQTGSLASAQRTVADVVHGYRRARANQRLTEATRDQERWLSGLIVEGLGHRRLAQPTVADCDDFLTELCLGLRSPPANTAAADDEAPGVAGRRAPQRDEGRQPRPERG